MAERKPKDYFVVILDDRGPADSIGPLSERGARWCAWFANKLKGRHGSVIMWHRRELERQYRLIDV